MEDTEAVTIILLNGTSSVGKTTIAKALQQILKAPYLHVPVDSFAAMTPGPDKLGEPGSPLWQSIFNWVLSGFHHSLAAMAAAGNNLIVDHVLIQGVEPQNWLTECLDLLAPFTVYLIGVHCPLEELRRREQARGDRGAGLAEFQWSRVHRHGVYDLEVDTSVSSSEQCALRIKNLVERNALRRRLSRFASTARRSSNALHPPLVVSLSSFLSRLRVSPVRLAVKPLDEGLFVIGLLRSSQGDCLSRLRCWQCCQNGGDKRFVINQGIGQGVENDDGNLELWQRLLKR